ncbi:hypothetical protein LXL04_006738 [Taraxacum kok-saghyz]
MTLSEGLTSHATCPISPTLSHYKYYSPSITTFCHHSPTWKNMKLQSSAALLLLSLLFTSSFIESAITASPTGAPGPSPSGSLGCDKKCAVRCSKTAWREMCLQLCGICCGKCNGCVPSGPRADKAECPCYRDMKNKKGKDKGIQLFNNKFSGSIPPTFSSCTVLQNLDFGNNSLVGEIPDSFGNCTKLYNVNLSLNSLTGSVPVSLSQSNSLMFLSLQFNNFLGVLPDSWGGGKNGDKSIVKSIRYLFRVKRIERKDYKESKGICHKFIKQSDERQSLSFNILPFAYQLILSSLHHNITRSPNTLPDSVPDFNKMKLSLAAILILAFVLTFSVFESATATAPTGGISASVSISVYAPSVRDLDGEIDAWIIEGSVAGNAAAVFRQVRTPIRRNALATVT